MNFYFALSLMLTSLILSSSGESIGSLLSFGFLILLLSLPIFLLFIHISRDKVVSKKNYERRF